MTTRSALILGATGGIGGAVMETLQVRGWHVKALLRRPDAKLPVACERNAGDAMDPDAVLAAANGADVIAHAVNPPGYRDWNKLVLPMLDNSIAAARATGSRIVLPGTVYNYGPDAFPTIDEEAQQLPLTRKGAIRVEMERRLRAAADAGDVRVLIVRAGDYFGPNAANNWFSQGMLVAGKRPSVVRQPGAAGIGHQWAYLPDVAETMAQLLERPALPAFARFHMQGHWDPDGRQMAEAIAVTLGTPATPIRALPWWQLRLASPFLITARELMEMRYLWKVPVRLTNDRLVAALGTEPHTPLADAVRATLAGLGCL